MVCEGPNLAGKTSFADAVEVIYLAVMGHDAETVTRLSAGPPAPPSLSPFIEYEQNLIRQMPDNPDELVICDRWALGEMVYGPLFRGASRLTPGGLLHCEMLFEALGAMRVMLMPSLAVLRARLSRRGDDLIDADDLAYEYEQYLRLAPRYGYRHLAGSPDEIMLKMMLSGMADRAENAAAIAHSAPGYIGTLHPRLVLAGDVRAGSDDPDSLFTHAFTPAAPGSASYLMDGLAACSRTVIKEIGILNTGEDGMCLKAAHEALGRPQWVALGNIASDRLAAAGLSHGKVPHPQWQRRFRYKQQREYIHRLVSGALSDVNGNRNGIRY